MKKLTTLLLVLTLSVIPFMSNSTALAATNVQTIAQKADGITNPVVEGAAGSDIEAAEEGDLFLSLLGGILSFVMLLATLLVLMNLVQAGIDWIGSGGDKQKLESARNRILNAIIGFIVLSASFAIWLLMRDFLGISFVFERLFP